MTEHKPPPRPEWASEVPGRTGRAFKVHNTFGQLKQAIAWRRNYEYKHGEPRRYYLNEPVKVWRWLNDEWVLVFEAEFGTPWEEVPWVKDKEWPRD